MTIKRATVAAPIFRNIALDIIETLDIKKRNNGLKKEYRYYDVKYVNVPNVVGMNLREARDYLKDFQIEYSGSGDRIVSISPSAGSSVVINSVVRVMLG